MIVLSWDGTRHDYPDRADTPALDRIERDGTRARRLTPVFPSNTFPSHVALATGTHPDRHGIVANAFHDAERGRFSYSNDASWIEAEPVWVAAERQGVTAATFFWVGSETDWNGVGATHRRAPFDSRISESAKVDQILEWIDLPPGQRPGLILSWWHGCDHVGHEKGPDDPAIAEQLARQDSELLRLLQGLDRRGSWGHTTLLVLGDHGMAPVTRRLDVIERLREAGIEARLVPGGGMAFLWLHRPEQRTAALEVLRGLEKLRAWPSDAMPDRLRSYRRGRSGHITLITEPPYELYPPRRRGVFAPLIERLSQAARGSHGFDPALPEMGAIFYAVGRGVPRGRPLDEVLATDVAATLTALLGIEAPRDSEGTPIFALPPSEEGTDEP